MKKLILVLMLLCMASVAVAQTYPADNPKPILSWTRLMIGVRGEYMFYQGDDSAVLQQMRYKKEWGFGVAAAYQIIPNLSLTWRTIYGVDSKLFTHAVGMNLLIFDGAKDR
jgi:hypothetical protein